MPEKDNKNINAIISLVFTALAIFLLIKYFKDIEPIILKSGVWAPLVSILLFTVLAITPISTDPITIIVGTIYGPIIGTLISWIGNTSAAFVEYYFGNKLNEFTNIGKIKDNLPFGLNKLPVSSPVFLIFGRMIPIYGGKIISIIAGIYKVPKKTYFYTTVITTFLGSLLLSLGGFHLIRLLIK